MANKKLRYVIYGGALYPPGRHHRQIVLALSRPYDKVFVVPSGSGRTDRTLLSDLNEHRKNLVRLNFGDLLGVEIDFRDLNDNSFTPTYRLWDIYSEKFPDAQLFMAVGPDLVQGGSSGNSKIQQEWKRGKEIWEQLNFSVINPLNFMVCDYDLPPSVEVVNVGNLFGRSQTIRQRLKKGEQVDDLVMPNVLKYITDNKLVF